MLERLLPCSIYHFSFFSIIQYGSLTIWGFFLSWHDRTFYFFPCDVHRLKFKRSYLEKFAPVDSFLAVVWQTSESLLFLFSEMSRQSTREVVRIMRRLEQQQRMCQSQRFHAQVLSENLQVLWWVVWESIQTKYGYPVGRVSNLLHQHPSPNSNMFFSMFPTVMDTPNGYSEVHMNVCKTKTKTKTVQHE